VTATLGISWIFWFLTYQSNRLLLPTCALALALGAAGLARWSAALAAPGRRTLHGLGAAGVALGLMHMVIILDAAAPAGGAPRADGWAVGLGFEDPNDYLARRVGYWTMAQRLAQRMGPTDRAMLVGEYRPLYFPMASPRSMIVSDWFDTPQPLPWIRRTGNNDEFVTAMGRIGVRYIFLNQGELSLYIDDYFRSRFTPQEFGRFVTLWSHPALRVVDEDRDRGIVIYEIEAAGGD
jgi:hypothetical protein